MYLCYVDESGSAELLHTGQPASTPVFVLAALVVPKGELRSLVWEYLQLKKTYNPSLANVRLHELIAREVKGADLRADLRSGSRSRSRRAVGLVEQVLRIVNAHSCRVTARVTVKAVGVPLNDTTVYTSSLRWICATFHEQLSEVNDQGLVVLDSRTKVKNTPNTQMVTTQMYKKGGDPMPRLVESPVFGHSDSHVALQIVDVLVSALLFPLACLAYCGDLSWNQHAQADYSVLRQRFGSSVKNLQYRYFDASAGQWRGGIYATGPAGGLDARRLWSDPTPSPRLALEWVEPSPS